MSLASFQISRAEILKRTGFEVGSHPSIKPLRVGFFRRIDIQVHGEAPKDFLRVYQYGRGRKSNPGSWPAYIAKVGQKYYPNESITEHLLTRLGEALGMDMASSRLMWVRGQLRFLSEYFLLPGESLIHGAEIFAGYLANDLSFVQQVEEKGMSNEIFTIQVVEAAMAKMFPDQAEAILQQFMALLGFDALVGNNDRHFFNWGVISPVAEGRPPRFAPIYDTARALFWNADEAGLAKHEHPNDFAKFVRRYSAHCFPKIGCDGAVRLNHFEMIRKIYRERPMYRQVLARLSEPDLPALGKTLIETEFKDLFSPLRKRFILECLRQRLEEYAKAVTLSTE